MFPDRRGVRGYALVVPYMMLGIRMTMLARLVACRIVARVVMVERNREVRISRLWMCNGTIDWCFSIRSTRSEWCCHEAGNGLGVSSPEQAPVTLGQQSVSESE